MPGHSFDVSGLTSAKPPRAKETMSASTLVHSILFTDSNSRAHLQSMSTQTPSLGSPSTSSLSSLATGGPPTQPTAQQILTARMLLVLLDSPPSYSIPLNALKDALSKGEGNAVGVTRPIYNCVAKRLLKIERGGGEQVVKFDV
jgi:hypothetical protein